MTIPNEERAELRQALRDFAASPRYNFLKSLQVGPILGDDAKSLGAVSQMTFEELVGAADNHASDLHQLNDAQERLLTAVLRALCEGESVEAAEPGFDVAEGAPEESYDEPEGETTATTFNSVQSELELRERIGQVKAHPDLRRVKDLPLGSFWAEASPRAPFEESLTIGQLLALDLGVLTKKRSMTSLRMRALACALENALQVLDGEASETYLEEAPQEPRSVPSRNPERRRSAPLRHKWSGHFDACSPSEAALVESVMRACSDDPADAETLFGALNHFCAVFSVSDFLTIMRGDALTIPAQRKLAAWAHSGALRRVVPIVQLMIQGPGAHTTRIARVLDEVGQVGAVHAIVATLITRGLGGSLVSLDGVRCPDVWTRNPKLVALIAKEVRGNSKSSTPQALSDVCPDLDPFLQSWLQGIVSPQKTGKKRHKRR